ncbi:MAG: serine/threonine protein kinase, partial [Deltaproteobacteria bacterium]|nr:serine/threonine protein kinase [Deltaproteobacteria bacterium]
PEPAELLPAPILRARMPSMPPAVGRYTLERLLGQGTFGRVFEARDSKLGRKLALKLLNPEQARCPEIRQRFVQEAHAAACINHPGIVTVFDAGELDDRGTAYIAMELLAGESLHARLIRRGAMPSAKVREIGRQAAAALHAAHQAGVIHRDLKPENIFVVPDPAAADGERIKVLDFGLAKPTLSASVKTQAATVFGTPAYMSPEQCESTRDIDHRSDIYALGCVLFQLVTGRLLFDGTMRELILQHRGTPAPSILTLVGNACPQLAALIASMLEKDPSKRPQTMAEVAQALSRPAGKPTIDDAAETREMPAIARTGRVLGLALVAFATAVGVGLTTVI